MSLPPVALGPAGGGRALQGRLARRVHLRSALVELQRLPARGGLGQCRTLARACREDGSMRFALRRRQSLSNTSTRAKSLSNTPRAGRSSHGFSGRFPAFARESSVPPEPGSSLASLLRARLCSGSAPAACAAAAKPFQAARLLSRCKKMSPTSPNNKTSTFRTFSGNEITAPRQQPRDPTASDPVPRRRETLRGAEPRPRPRRETPPG